MPADYAPESTQQALSSLRLALRQQRRKLSHSQQLAAELKIKSHLKADNHFNSATHIATYLACDGEANLMATIQWAWQQRKHCYLPVLDFNDPQQEGGNHQPEMRFKGFSVGTTLKTNRFNIKEPSQTREIHSQDLDIVLTPLVGFNWLGQRLGMGGGFYDRTFSSPKRRPLLLGVAHSCQYHHDLVQRPWDVNLDGIVTEKGLVWFE